MKRGISNWIVLALVFFCTCAILGFVPNTSEADSSDVEDFVTRFYELCLGRPPDSAGLDGWVSALLDGTQTGSDVAYGFVFSEEFLSKNITDEEYLQVLYEAFFDRPPGSAGKQGWLDAMKNGASRKDLLNGFIYAQEFNNLCWEYGISPNPIAAFVTRFYTLCLNRSPDRAGLDGWTNELLSRTRTGADVAYGFVFSQEFLRKYTSNEDYLNTLYDAFFDRQPDQAGWNTWLAELDGGRNRRAVLNGFIYSAEFAALCQKYGITPFSSDPAEVDNDYDGFSENQGDCADADPDVYPGADEICGDGIDQNCDGVDPECPPSCEVVCSSGCNSMSWGLTCESGGYNINETCTRKYDPIGRYSETCVGVRTFLASGRTYHYTVDLNWPTCSIFVSVDEVGTCRD